MINQKPISFKIYLDNLEGIDEFVRNYPYYTNRNHELNKAVAMYLEMHDAVFEYYHHGDPTKIRAFMKNYFSRNPGRLFD